MANRRGRRLALRLSPRPQLELWLGLAWLGLETSHCTPSLWYRVPKRRPTTIWRRGNTQKKIYNIQITAKVWNQEGRIVANFRIMSWNLHGKIDNQKKIRIPGSPAKELPEHKSEMSGYRILKFCMWELGGSQQYLTHYRTSCLVSACIECTFFFCKIQWVVM